MATPGWEGHDQHDPGARIPSDLPGFLLRRRERDDLLGQCHRVLGSGHTLSLNTADHSGEDGFDIHATGVALTGNKALYTAGTAFEIDSSATGITSVSGNLVLYGNAVGLCNAGGATIGTNSFGPTIANPPSSGQCNEASGFIGD